MEIVKAVDWNIESSNNEVKKPKKKYKAPRLSKKE